MNRSLSRLSAAVLGVAVAATVTPVASAFDITGSLPSLPGSSVPQQSNPADNLPSTFDLQSHRGGRGEHTEESRAAFEHSLDLGVTTLELDIHMSADGVPVVWHDAAIQDDKCTGDAVGDDIHDLTWDQIQGLNCNLALDGFPDAVHGDDNRILQLSDVFDIAERDPQVHFNIETKIEAEDPERSAPGQEYVDAILDAADEAGTTDRITVQSFDWSSLPLVRERDPQVPLVALWDDSTWTSGSPYLGPVDYDAVGGDVIEGARQLDVEVLSPGYEAVEPESFVPEAQEAGFTVVPWTVNEAEDMERWIDAGADGVITDYPTRLKDILDERGVDYRA